MNPRSFCRERTFHKALLLTYSFDPIFFENVVLRDLWVGRAGDILTIGDRDQISKATEGATVRSLSHLGKSYLLAGANHDGAFHPKLMLRLGARDGAVLIGSGNLTSSGWGGNQEMGAAWMIGPEHSDKGVWLRAFLADVMTWCSSDLERDAVSRMRDMSWLSSLAPSTPTTSAVLYSRRDTTLARQLAERWSGRQFDSLRILTGSTDQSGAFLRWAHATFGIRRAVVALTPSMASFDPAKLADLPIELTLVAAPPDRPMHAKFYWFEGELGAAAVMGSANCSAAAWLLKPASGGNVETMVVYDKAAADAYKEVLAIFERPAQTPSELLTQRVSEPLQTEKAAYRYRLLGLRWDKDSQEALAVIHPGPTVDMSVDLIVDTQTLPMNPQSPADGRWVCAVPDGFGASMFLAVLRISTGGSSWTTAPRWIDDLASLRHASQSARLLEPFRGLERSATPHEQRQMLEDLQEVAHALFNDGAAFRDPGTVATSEKGASESEAIVAPVNPNDLVCHLDKGLDSIPLLDEARDGTLSFSGILRMLFESDGDQLGADADGEGPDEGMRQPDSEGTRRTGEREAESPVQEALPVEARFRDRLATQIAAFLIELRSMAFAERCSATQMVQAVAFPLAVALRGRKRGWVSPDLAERWGQDVISILFRGPDPDAGGLLHAVERRYAENGQSEVFGEVIGDGTLWIVLVSTLGGTRWRGPGAYLDKAIALRDVFTSSQLLASARRERINELLSKVRIEDARTHVATVAPAVARLLDEIEERLQPIWIEVSKTQEEQRTTRQVGDLFWRNGVGWAVCLEEDPRESSLPIRVRLKGQEKRVMPGFYVNVTALACENPELQHCLVDLQARIDTEANDGERVALEN
jgi:hypothetical protein